MNWKGVKTLVTGAGGFIGSHLTEELLAGGASVRALVHYNARGHWGHLEDLPRPHPRRLEVLAGDVTDPYAMREAVRGREVVFHLAALIAIPYSYRSPASYVRTNVEGTLNVLEACRAAGVKRLVHTSTSEVYGTAVYAPIDEKHPLQGQSPYSASKIGADKLAESYWRSFGLPVVTVRPFNTYGPRQSARAVIPAILVQLLSGAKELRLGDLSPVRDFNFVADTVDGFLRAAAAPKLVGETVNVGSGRGWTIRQVAERACRLTGNRIPVRRDAARMRPGHSEVYRLLCDNRKARSLAGWRPRYSLDEGLALSIQYIRAHLSEYKSGIYNV
ncbi:MAG TPA: NAD-dependent dehydratase [Elusimicrobia bacterium]|nr:NAD-dependent dehydratase [Elusimicrobiota bacterium]